MECIQTRIEFKTTGDKVIGHVYGIDQIRGISKLKDENHLNDIDSTSVKIGDKDYNIVEVLTTYFAKTQEPDTHGISLTDVAGDVAPYNFQITYIVEQSKGFAI